MSQPIPVILLLLALLFTPALAWANAGTPLMWAEMLYLFGGNVVLGIVEGLVLVWWFRLSMERCVGWMIVANLVSAWVGQVLLTGAIVSAVPLDIYTLRMFLVLSLVVAWLVTLVVEWPFIALCFWGLPDWLRRSLLATAVIQTASCMALGAFFFMASFFSLVTDHRIVPPEEISWPGGLVVYYIDADGRTIHAFDTDTGETTTVHVMSTNERPWRSAVYFAPKVMPEDSEIRMLITGEYGGSHLHDHQVEELGVRVDTSTIHRVGRHGQEESRARFPFGHDWHPYGPHSEPVSIGQPEPELKGIRQGFWAAEGLSYRYGDDERAKNVRLSLETPFAIYEVRHTMLLGDGLVMFQLGRDQICLLDMKTQRVALKLRGFGPLAVPKEAVMETTASVSPAHE